MASYCAAMRDYKMIDWDLDGTLLDSGSMWDEGIQESLHTHHIVCTPQEKHLLASIPLKMILHQKGVPEEIITAVYDTLSVFVIERVQAGSVQWREGAEETLALSKIPQAIVTSSNNAFFELIDKQLNIRSRVQAVITFDDVHGYCKPHSTGLLLASDQLGIDRRNGIYIGDQLCDLQAAKNAGMDALLLRGAHTPTHAIHTTVATTFKGVRNFLKTSFRSSL